MKPTYKQTALKASLFMILAANVSWQTSKTFNASDFASNSELAVNRGSVPGRTGGAAAPVAVVRIAPAPAASGPRPDAPITAAAVDVKEKFETHTICSLDFKIHFIQNTSAVSGKPVVHAYVTQVNPERTLDGLKQDGTYRDLIGNPASKAKWDDLIASGVTKVLKQEGRACDGSDSDNRPVVDRREREDRRDDRRDDRRNRDDAEDQRIARGVDHCTLDEDGEALRNSDRASCNLQRLAAINLDASADEDRDEDDRGSRRRRDTSSEGIREVQDALEPLKTSIRSLLLSTNSKRRSDGRRLMNKVLAALVKVERTASTSSDERAMRKISDNLDKAYTLGERVNDAAAVKADKLAEIDEKVSDLNLRAMTSQNPYERYELQRQANSWNQYRSTEVTRLTQNPDYLKLRAYAQAGIIDQTELADFTADTNSLAQAGQQASPSGFNASNDVITGRSNIGDARAQGAGLPAYPQINYSGLGLNNPGVAGGAQPMIPSPQGFPQTSGYPVTTGFPQSTMPYQPVNYTPQFPGQFGAPNSNLPMTLPMNVPITQGYNQPGFQTQNGWQGQQAGYYNPSMMSQPMRFN